MCISNNQLEIFHGFKIYSTYCNSYSIDGNNVSCKSCIKGYVFNGTDCVEKCANGETSVNDFLESVSGQLLYKKEKKCFAEVTTSGKYGQTKAFDNNFIPLNSLTGKNLKNDHTKPLPADVRIATKSNVPFGTPVSNYLYQFPKYTDTIDDANLTKKVDQCFNY